MSLAGLPDISDEDWLLYQSQEFRRGIKPVVEASEFRSSIQPILATAEDNIASMSQPIEEPAPVQQAQAIPTDWDEMGQPVDAGVGQADGRAGDVFGSDFGSRQSLFGQQPAPPSSLLRELQQLPPTRAEAEPGLWSGTAPEKPNVFSWLGSEAQRGAEALRSSGASQTPIIGGIATGTAQAAANALNNLGGTAEALRQGNIPGAAGGVLQATIGENSPLGWGKEMATEAGAPEQILPFIKPDTPVLGGLNNPRELAGLIPQLAVPETALERGAMDIAGRVARPVARAAGDVLAPAARRIGEVASRGMDELGGLMDRAFPDLSYGITRTQPETRFHGTSVPFERVDPASFKEEGSLYTPDYYTTANPDVAGSYATEVGRGNLAQPLEDVQPWTTSEATGYLDRFDRWAQEERAKATDPKSAEMLDNFRQRLPREIYDDNGYVKARRPSQSADELPYDFSDPSYGDSEIDRAWAEAWGDLQRNYPRPPGPLSGNPGGWGSMNRPTSHFVEQYDMTDRLQALRESVMDEYKPGPQSNIRKITVPAGFRMLDIDNTVPDVDIEEIRAALDTIDSEGYTEMAQQFLDGMDDARFRRLAGEFPAFQHTLSNQNSIGEDVFRGLYTAFDGDRYGIARFLEDNGYDGITHLGGTRRPMTGPNGQPLTHQVDIVFQKSLPKITNAISGQPGGIVSGAMTGGRYYHGTTKNFRRARVPGNGGRSYALPGYYATPDPEVAGRYAGYVDDLTGAVGSREGPARGGRIRAFDLDPDTNLFDARRVLPEDEIRQIVEEMQRISPDQVPDPERLISSAVSRQQPPWGGNAIGALFTLRGANTGLGIDTTDTLVQALKNMGYHGVRADEGGEIISLFDNGIMKARNVLSGEYGGIAERAMTSPFFSPARTGAQAASDIGMGVAGGVAGAATAPEDATWQERAGRAGAGFALGAMGGPIARAPKGIGGLVRGLVENEDGSFNLGAISGRLDPPEDIPEEAWRGMSRNERRRANWERRRGEYAARPRSGEVPDYTTGAGEKIGASDVPTAAADQTYDDVYGRQRDLGYGEQDADETAWTAARSSQVEAEEEMSRRAQRLYDDNPDLQPDESPTPKQTADEAVKELTEGAQIPGALGRNPIVQERAGGFIGGQEGLDQPGTTGAIRKIAETTGSPAVGSEVSDTIEQLEMPGLNELLDPDKPMPYMKSRDRAAIERGEQIGADDTPMVQDHVKRVTRAFATILSTAHGRKSDEFLQEAVRDLEPWALDIARTANPGDGTSDLLVALMNRAVEATDTPAKLAYDRWRYAIKTGADAETVAALERNALRTTEINAIYRIGQEVYSSEAGRALRANRADVFGSASFIPRVAGAAYEEGSDIAMRDLQGLDTTPPRLKAREKLAQSWKARLKELREGAAEEVSGEGRSWDDIYWQEHRRAMISAGPSGRSQGGALEREGLLWRDLFIRDDRAMEGTGAKLTENERLRWQFGLEEVGLPKERRDTFMDRMMDINPDDRPAVLQFWGDVAKEAGVTTTKVPISKSITKAGVERRRNVKVQQFQTPWEAGIQEVDAARALPNKIADDWQGYLDAAETMTRSKAIDLAERVIKGRLDKATKGLEESQTAGDSGAIKRFSQAVASAKKDLTDGNGLLARIERQYPPDIKGRSQALQGEANRAVWEAGGKTGDEAQALRDRASELVEQSGPAWQREQYRPGFQQGFYDDPVATVRKAQLLQELDEVSRGVNLTRGALSVATSNMLTSARMVEASALESAVMMVNRLYTQAVWRGDPQGAVQLARGMWAGVTPAFHNMVYAMKNGMGPMEALDFLQDVARNQAPAIRSQSLAGNYGYLAPMHRVSRGLQEFFTTVGYYGELNRLAHGESVARATGERAVPVTQLPNARGPAFPAASGGMTRMTPSEKILPRADISPETFFNNPTEEMRKAALQEAAKIAAGGPHSAVASMIAGMKSNLETGKLGESGRAVGAVLNVLFPFVYGIDFSIRSGLKILGGPVYYPIRGAAALKAGDTAAAKGSAAAFGLTLMTDMFLFDQIRQGNITGKGPSDPEQRQALLETVDENGDPVWRPDSMRVPLPNGQHLWMNYTSLPVIGVTGAIMSNMWDAYVWDGKKDMAPAERFATLAANTAGSIAEGTFFRDTLDLASILTQPQSATTALSRFAGSMVSRAIPGGSLLRQIAYASDPERKTPENFGQELMQGVPGLRGMVPEQVSPYTGGDVNMGYSWATPFAPGTVYYGQQGQNPLAGETSRLQRQGLNVSPSGYSATQQGRGATIFEQRQPGSVVRGVQEQVAQETGPRALSFINSPQYQAMSDQDKAASLEQLFTQSRTGAKYGMQDVPGINLSLSQQATHLTSGLPKYYGVKGTPEEIDRRNREIGQAKSALSEFSRLYGPDMAEIMLRRMSRQAWRDAMLYEEVDPDLAWMRQRRTMREAGITPEMMSPTDGQAPLGLEFVQPGVTPNLQAPPQRPFNTRVQPSARR